MCVTQTLSILLKEDCYLKQYLLLSALFTDWKICWQPIFIDVGLWNFDNWIFFPVLNKSNSK